MPLPQNNPEQCPSWARLKTLANTLNSTTLIELFKNDANRTSNMSIEWKDFYVDFSKNLITEEAWNALYELAAYADLDAAINAYFNGDLINETEGRAVLHTALRAAHSDAKVNGEEVNEEVVDVKRRIQALSDAVISGAKKGYTNKPFTDIVNIGIGGSDLGPVMVTEALAHYKNHLKVHFMSNVDPDHSVEVLKGLNPETTLFLVVSKSFGTQETLMNAQTVRRWFVEKASEEAIAAHFAAVSTNLTQTSSFGISNDMVFPMADWVGGRFSLWSAVGLSIALSVGYEHFEALLAGAAAMDQHFAEAPAAENLPVKMALLGIWYTNFMQAETEAVIPYTQYLHRFSAYLQQASMESNGKSTTRSGDTVSYQTGSIVWGEPGTNSQHAFFQLIHQGTKLIPCDFIGFRTSLNDNQPHQDALMANFFAQTEALMKGKTIEEVTAEFVEKGVDLKSVEHIIPHKVFAGNKPTTTFLIESLIPYNLGALISAYEHKIFVQGVVWNVFSYDQWGVELGKQLANRILGEWQNGIPAEHDQSTQALLKRYKN
ncbi:MAG: glucose-6-phosphate isomerase [Flavobacteriaceae bacterium]